MTLEETKKVFEIAALVIAGGWAIYGFLVLRQREKAAADLRKVELESIKVAVVRTDITARSELRPDVSGYCILADVTLVNDGRRDTRLKWQGEPPAFAVRRASFAPNEAPTFPHAPIEVPVREALDPSIDAFSTVLRAGATQRFAFAIAVSHPGIYLLSFRAVLAPEERLVSGQAGADPRNPLSWTATKYVVVPATTPEMPRQENYG